MFKKVIPIILIISLILCSLSFAVEPPYTHTYEIKVGMVDMQGEIVFNHGNEPSFNTSAPIIGLPIKALDAINNLIKAMASVTGSCGEITKIEFNKKP